MKTLERPTRDRAALIALGALLAALIGYPLVELVRAALDQGWGAFFDALTGRGTPEAVWNTVWTGAAVTAISLLGGTGAALITERSSAGRRRWLRMGMLLPILIPPFVSALGWAEAYGPAGLLDDLLGIDLLGHETNHGARGVELAGVAGSVAHLAEHRLVQVAEGKHLFLCQEVN